MAEIAGYVPGRILKTGQDQPLSAVSIDNRKGQATPGRTPLEKGLDTLVKDTPRIAALLLELKESKDRDQMLRALRGALELVEAYDNDDCLRRILCFLAAGQNEAESEWVGSIRKPLELVASDAARSYLLAVELGNSTGSVRTCNEVYAVCNIEAEQVALYMLPLGGRI